MTLAATGSFDMLRTSAGPILRFLDLEAEVERDDLEDEFSDDLGEFYI